MKKEQIIKEAVSNQSVELESQHNIFKEKHQSKLNNLLKIITKEIEQEKREGTQDQRMEGVQLKKSGAQDQLDTIGKDTAKMKA